MTTNISRETGLLSLLLRSPAKFEPYALRLPSPSSLFSILNEDFIQVSYSDLLSASWQRDAWQYVKSLRRRAYLREKNKKEKEMEFLSSFSSSLLSRGIYFSSRFETGAFYHPILRGKRFDAEQSTREQSCQARRHPLNN